MPDVAGRIEAIKKRLMTLIQNSSTWLDSNNVSAEQDKVGSYLMGKYLPFVTIRFGPTTETHVYGRQIISGTGGRYVDIPFSIHLFQSACTASGEARERYAHQIADEIIDYLDSKRNDEMSNNIIDIYNLRMREAPVRGAGVKTVRIIIEGNLLTKREDV